MPILREPEAPTFNLPGLTVRGLAAPSRGSAETSVWRLRLEPGVPGREHSVDREEIFVVLSGRGRARLGAETIELLPGDTLIVPQNLPFSLENSGTEPFDAVAVAPVGVKAQLPGGEAFAPPWTL